MFAAGILAWLWLNEKITAIEVIAMLLAFYGIYLTQKKTGDEPTSMTETSTSAGFSFGIVLAVLSFIGMGSASVCSRRLKECNFAVLQFNQAFLSTVICGTVMVILCINARALPFRYDSYWTYAEMVAAALANWLGQTLFVICNQNTNPATVALLAYVGVLYMFGSDFIFFHQTITPIQYVGVSICLMSSVGVVIYKMLNKPNPAK